MTYTVTKAGVRQTSKVRTHRQILKTALDLFSKQGFVETRAEEIAQKAKVAVGTIYLHFQDKDGLLREILLEAADEIFQRVLAVYQHPPIDPYDLARAHVGALVDYLEEHQRVAGFVLGLLTSGHPAAKPMLEKAIRQVEQSIRIGQTNHTYRSDIDPALAARAEAQMNLGLLAWWAQNPRSAIREEIIDTLARFRFSGLHSGLHSNPRS